MRVIAGIARSLPLKAPEGKGTRPTTDRVKETLFNMLQPYIPDCIFIDLFSGSGGIGIEALSRGAKKAYFAENNAQAFECIRQNVKFTKFEEQSVLLKQDALTALSLIQEEEADIIFMDPPYDAGYGEKALGLLSERPYVTENTLIIMEAALDTDFSFADTYGFEVTKEKKYKTNKHVFMMRREN